MYTFSENTIGILRFQLIKDIQEFKIYNPIDDHSLMKFSFKKDQVIKKTMQTKDLQVNQF